MDSTLIGMYIWQEQFTMDKFVALEMKHQSIYFVSPGGIPVCRNRTYNQSCLIYNLQREH